MEWLWNLHCFVNQSPLESPLCTQCTNRIFFFLKRQWFFCLNVFIWMGAITLLISTPYPFPTCLPTSTMCQLILAGEEGFLNSTHALLVFLLLTVSSWEKEQTFGNLSCLNHWPQNSDHVTPTHWRRCLQWITKGFFLPWCIAILKNWVVRQDTC